MIKQTYKKWIAACTVTSSLLLGACTSTPPSVRDVSIVPLPNNVQQDSSAFVLPKSCTIGITDSRLAPAAEYLAGEEERNTPCTPGGAYDRLKDCGGKILLVGVGHERNTYIHSVEEVLNVPNRLAAEPMLLTTILPDGREKKVYMRKHYNPDQPHISEDFVKLNQAFLDCGAVEVVMFGDAKCLLCDAQKVFRVVRHVLAPDPECLVTKPEISAERWMNFE